MRGLRTFCVAARRCSFSLAAEELYVSASAVSHQVRALERELQTELFVRKAQALELTEGGRALFHEIDPLIRQIDAATGRLASRLSREILRISVQPFFASEMFVPRLPEFTEQHPEIGIHVDIALRPPASKGHGC